MWSPAIVGHQGLILRVVSSTGTWLWSHLPASVSAPLMLLSVMTVSWNSASWRTGSSACTHLLLVLTFTPGEGGGRLLRPTSCTEISFFNRSVWVDVSAFSGAFSIGTLVLALRRVPSVWAETWGTSLGCGPSCSCSCPRHISLSPESCRLLSALPFSHRAYQHCCCLPHWFRVFRVFFRVIS